MVLGYLNGWMENNMKESGKTIRNGVREYLDGKMGEYMKEIT